jgi:hypothetical protein
MSDRWVFATAFLTVVLIVAGAFAIPEYFSFELVRSTIFVAIAVMVFFGEDRYSYMLGAIAPPVEFILNMLLGGFFSEFHVLWNYVTRQEVSQADTPLHGFAILSATALMLLSIRAYRRQVPERFFGKTFYICLAISLAYAGLLAAWYYNAIPAAGRMP